MVQHNSLTGSDLHECKGADSAAANTVRVSDGSGSGTWKKITVDSIDATSFKTVNKDTVTFYLDPAVTTTFYVPIEATKTLTGIYAIANTTTSGNVTLSAAKNGTAIGTTFNLANTAASRASQVYSTSFLTTDSLSIGFTGVVTSPVTLALTFSY